MVLLPGFTCRAADLMFETGIHQRSCVQCYSWVTHEFMLNLMTTRCSGPVAAKQAQIITPPPPCLTLGIRCFNMLFLVFTKCITVHYDHTCPLWSCLAKWHCSRSLAICLVLRCPAMWFVKGRGFLLTILPNRQYLCRPTNCPNFCWSHFLMIICLFC